MRVVMHFLEQIADQAKIWPKMRSSLNPWWSWSGLWKHSIKAKTWVFWHILAQFSNMEWWIPNIIYKVMYTSSIGILAFNLFFRVSTSPSSLRTLTFCECVYMRDVCRKFKSQSWLAILRLLNEGQFKPKFWVFQQCVSQHCNLRLGNMTHFRTFQGFKKFSLRMFKHLRMLIIYLLIFFSRVISSILNMALKFSLRET